MEERDDKPNSLSGWFDVISASGKDRKKKEQELREKLMARKHIVAPESDEYFETWLWRGKGCVVAAAVREGIIDVFSIKHYSFEFIRALNGAEHDLR